MNETYQEYINRVVPMTLNVAHEVQLSNIQKSAKFEEGKPVAFPGYTIMTPTMVEDEDNQGFYESIQACQKQLIEELDSQLLITVPPESFHLTVADLLWDNTYLAGVRENPDFETNLQKEVDNSFTKYKTSQPASNPIELQLLGLTIFPRALAVCLVAKSEPDYINLTNIRQAVYQNRYLIGLGVQQQYTFIAHITVGYFGEINPESDRDLLAQTLTKINEQWIDSETPSLKIRRIQLRKFDNMINYYRQPDWPEIVI